MEKLPWWDTAKNSMGKMGKGFGLTTHEITTDDYVWNPKRKKFEYDWKVARENDKKRGLATSTLFDPMTAINKTADLAVKFK